MEPARGLVMNPDNTFPLTDSPALNECDCILGPPLLGGGSAEAAVGVAWLRASMLGPAPWDEGEDEGEGPAAEAECQRTCAGRRRAPSRDSAPSSRSRPSTRASGLRLSPPPPLRPERPAPKEADHICAVCAPPPPPRPGVPFVCHARRRPPSRPLRSRDFLYTPSQTKDEWWKRTAALPLEPEPPLSPPWVRRPFVNIVGAVGDAGWLAPADPRHAAVTTIETILDRAFALADADKHSHSSYGSPNFGGIALDLDRGRAADSSDDIPCEPCLRLNEPPRDARDIWRNLQAKPQT